MENSLHLLLILVGVALLLASISLVVVVLCLYRLVQQRPPIVAWTMNSTPSGVTLTPPAAEPVKLFRRRRRTEPAFIPVRTDAPKPFICVHCHTYLPLLPHHGVVHEEKAYVVYVCEKCGKETELPGDHAPSTDNPPNQSV